MRSKRRFCVLCLVGITAIGFGHPAGIYTELHPLARSLAEITGCQERAAIYEVFGELVFERIETDYPGYSCWSTLKCYGAVDPLMDPKADGLLIHELGHVFLNRLELSYCDLEMDLGYFEDGVYVHVAGVNPVTGNYERSTRGYGSAERPDIQHGELSPDFNSYKEDFADMFMNWARDSFSDDEAGRLRYEWMDAFVRAHVAKLHGEGPQICTVGGVTCAR